MTRKTFYIDLEKQKFNETMIINKQVSFNHIVRERGRKSKIQVLDNHSSVSSVLLQRKAKKWQPFHLTKLQLQHPRHKIFRFKFDIASKTYGNYNHNQFESFWNIYKNLASNPNKKYPVMILNPVIGGYLGYSFNIIAYIPQDQYQLSRKSYLSHSTFFTKIRTALFSSERISYSRFASKKGRVIFNEIPHRLPFILRSEYEWINKSDSNFSMENPPEKTDVSNMSFVFINYEEQVRLQQIRNIKKLEKEKLPENKTYEQKNKNERQIKEERFGKLKSKPTTQKESSNSNYLFKSDNNRRSTTTQNDKALLLHHKE